MIVQFKGQEAVIEKHDFYCKAGAYEHKYRTGWVLTIDGEIELGWRTSSSNICAGADGHWFPEYKTRKSLLEDIKFFNDMYDARAAKKLSE